MGANLLIAYSTSEGQTAKVADRIAAVLREQGHIVAVEDLRRSHPEPAAFDAVLIGGSAHAGKFQKEIGKFVEDNLQTLEAKPAWFFSVSLSEAIDAPPFGHEHALEQIEALLHDTGWQPRATASFGGSIKYRDYPWYKRMGMRAVAEKTGAETDTSRNWDYTDWDAVEAFAKGVGHELSKAQAARASVP